MHRIVGSNDVRILGCGAPNPASSGSPATHCGASTQRFPRFEPGQAVVQVTAYARRVFDDRAGRAQVRVATTVGAAAADAALVLAFVLIGRGSHSEQVVVGSLVTVWPFGAGLVVGWLASRLWRRPFTIRPTGLVVWATTVIVGMLLRAASGQGVQPAFVVVTAVVLALFLLGWRLLAMRSTAVIRRRSAASQAPSGGSPS